MAASRSSMLLGLLALVAAGVAWVVLGRSDPDVDREIEFGEAVSEPRGRGTQVRPLPGDPTAPPYFEIALEGTSSWQEAVQKQIELRIPVDSRSENYTGAALLDAMTSRMRVRFESDADAREFRTREAPRPLEPQGNEMVALIGELHVLVDRLGYVVESSGEGEILLIRPRHTLHQGD